MSALGLARNWWLLVLRGLSAILFGLAVWVWPNLTLATLALFLGIYLLLDGVFAISAGLGRYKGSQPWWWLLIEGAFGLAAGTFALLSPHLSAFTILYLLAVWAISTGLLAIMAAIQLRKEVVDEGLLALSGVLTVGLGMILMIWPEAVALTAVWFIGGYALASGLLLIGLGFRLWNWQCTTRLFTQPVWVNSRRLPHTSGDK
jgi:uncharacterized membrane protein HdeD (DUF308 family)